jgi:hypothetical protein
VVNAFGPHQCARCSAFVQAKWKRGKVRPSRSHSKQKRLTSGRSGDQSCRSCNRAGDDLRTALDAARAAIPLSPLTYTDPTLTAGTTKINAARVTEVRNGVK